MDFNDYLPTSLKKGKYGMCFEKEAFFDYNSVCTSIVSKKINSQKGRTYNPKKLNTIYPCHRCKVTSKKILIIVIVSAFQYSYKYAYKLLSREKYAKY